MANQITGKIEYLGATTAVATRSGDTFQRRELALEVVVYDRNTGDVVSENHPMFVFQGKNCDKLDTFQVGDMVTIDFVIDGRWYLKDGEKRNFTKVVGYNVQPVQGKAKEIPAPVREEPKAQPQSVQHYDTLPF